MNTVTLHNGVSSLTVSDVLALLGIPSRQSKKHDLSGMVQDAVTSITELVDELVRSVIEKRTAADFQQAEREAFPTYARVMLALSSIVRSTVPPPVIERVGSEALSELEADFRERGISVFGSAVQNQALFTVWTLRKINDLSDQVISAGSLPGDRGQEDLKFAQHFAVHVLRARFSLHCLTTSLERPDRYPLYPDVLDIITDGLRSVVNAYSWIRQALDLRIQTPEPAFEQVEWDDEDDALLAASTGGMAYESFE